PSSSCIRCWARRISAMPELSMNVTPARSSTSFFGSAASMDSSSSRRAFRAPWWSSSPFISSSRFRSALVASISIKFPSSLSFVYQDTGYPVFPPIIRKRPILFCRNHTPPQNL
ncbi:Haemolysin XhlA, partial [Dysosmobacter welbionis]